MSSSGSTFLSPLFFSPFLSEKIVVCQGCSDSFELKLVIPLNGLLNLTKLELLEQR